MVMFGNILRQNPSKTYTKLHKLLYFSKFPYGSMPTYPHSKRAAIISLFLYENDHFLYQLLSKCIICSIFFSGSLTLHSKRACNIISFHIKNGNFKKYFKKKSDQNIHQNANFFKIFPNKHTPEPFCLVIYTPLKKFSASLC